MKREFQSQYLSNEQNGFVPGDEAAHRAAAALADRADAPTIAALSDVVMLLERLGGQCHVTALRIEHDEGEFETVALGFKFNTLDAKGKTPAPPPRDVLGVPIAESDAEPTEIELPGTENEVDLSKLSEEQRAAAEKLFADHPDAETGGLANGAGGVLAVTLDDQEWLIDVQGGVTTVDQGEQPEPEKEPALSE